MRKTDENWSGVELEFGYPNEPPLLTTARKPVQLLLIVLERRDATTDGKAETPLDATAVGTRIVEAKPRRIVCARGGNQCVGFQNRCSIPHLDHVKRRHDYEEEFAKGQLDVIVQERESEIAQARLARKERETERAYELEKLKKASAAETKVSQNSTRSEGCRNRREIKHLMQKFDSQNTDISLYLTLFERQARAAGIEEEEWVSQQISLLPLDLSQIIIKELEEQMREYTNVKKVIGLNLRCIREIKELSGKNQCSNYRIISTVGSKA
ncbi:hypothetical protein AVEN_199259-1 [Araneus ventricosus]|uniref:Uncharacterized protein n=1 Tax=Araneus ventricosus TaxID=182803 RepID=A0A4Y2K0B9_ARAVE|nr:hypothetical protein AVEN_199259-1 [Araneus ventricosus]